MYFGLCNSPGTFMRMMAMIFRDMIRMGKCAIYMDDIVFCGKTKDIRKPAIFLKPLLTESSF
jgi:hypothetical protein